MNRLSACLVILAIAAIAISACSSTPETVDDATAALEDSNAYQQGHQAMEQGRWEEASQFYGQAADEAPQNWSAHLNHAIALTRDESFRQGLEAFGRALEQGGEDEAIVYYNLGNLYQAWARYDLSIDPYRTALALSDDPDLSFDAILNLSASLSFINALDDAHRALDDAQQMRPDDPRPQLTRGVVLQHQDRSPEALELYDALLSAHPDYVAAHFHRAYVLMRLERHQEALEGFQTYLAQAPDGDYRSQAESHISTLELQIRRR